jgi:co-chaperonin GroES (HSP10)
MIDIDKIAPQRDRCLVEPYKSAKTTESGLELAEKENEATPVMGVIRRAGPHSIYEVGQHILFRRYGIDELKLQTGADDLLVYIIADDEVVAVIEP